MDVGEPNQKMPMQTNFDSPGLALIDANCVGVDCDDVLHPYLPWPTSSSSKVVNQVS